MRMIRRRCVLLASAATAGLVFAAEVTAQQQVAAADQLQEVVVTGEKRSETAQSTPISITAITGQDIGARGVTDFDTLAQSVPGVP
jgi:iron complex outermembrane recepter protein